MSDIKSPKVLKLKGLMFLFLGLASGALLLSDSFSLKNLTLLLICIWSFSRFYYFAFYVLEHYADPKFRYAGLMDLFGYLMGRKNAGSPKMGTRPEESDE